MAASGTSLHPRNSTFVRTFKSGEGAILACPHATTLKGVPAAGDMPLNSLSRVASSSCEGSVVTLAINQMLADVEAA
jgi:hypothetical protein